MSNFFTLYNVNIADDDKRNKLILGDIHTSSRANYSDKIIIKIKINYV
jgi:hypothetical protein